MAAPAPHNAAALVGRQINGLLDRPFPSTLRRHAESMKRLGYYASPGGGPGVRGIQRRSLQACSKNEK